MKRKVLLSVGLVFLFLFCILFEEKKSIFVVINPRGEIKVQKCCQECSDFFYNDGKDTYTYSKNVSDDQVIFEKMPDGKDMEVFSREELFNEYEEERIWNVRHIKDKYYMIYNNNLYSYTPKEKRLVELVNLGNQIYSESRKVYEVDEEQNIKYIYCDRNKEIRMRGLGQIWEKDEMGKAEFNDKWITSFVEGQYNIYSLSIRFKNAEPICYIGRIGKEEDNEIAKVKWWEDAHIAYSANAKALYWSDYLLGGTVYIIKEYSEITNKTQIKYVTLSRIIGIETSE